MCQKQGGVTFSAAVNQLWFDIAIARDAASGMSWDCINQMRQ